jgi:hypothetical protein
MARPPRKEADRVLLQTLACGGTVENAARKAGVGERTVYRRLADPDFRRQISDLRTEMQQRTLGMLIAASTSSVKVLVDLQGDVSVPPGVRRRSARDVLEMAVKFRESLDWEQRLAAIEARLASAADAQAAQRSSDANQQAS